MLAVMLNPAEPIREVIVDCKRKGSDPDEVGKEARTYTGRAGGRIIITQELWDWIRAQATQHWSDIYVNTKRKPKQEDIINGIKAKLITGDYNGEEISLGYSTIEKILSLRYNEMLRAGAPASEHVLKAEELQRDWEQEHGEERLDAEAQSEKFLSQIWQFVKTHRGSEAAIYQAETVKKFKALFPSVIEWPRKNIDLPDHQHLQILKMLVKKATELQIEKFRMRPPRKKYRRYHEDRPPQAEDAEFMLQ